MAEKAKRKEQEMASKRKEYERSLQIAEEFKAEAEKKKQEKFQKNREHIKLLDEQVK